MCTGLCAAPSTHRKHMLQGLIRPASRQHSQEVQGCIPQGTVLCSLQGKEESSKVVKKLRIRNAGWQGEG